MEATDTPNPSAPKPVRLLPHHLSREKGERGEIKQEISEARGPLGQIDDGGVFRAETPGEYFARTTPDALPLIEEYRQAREEEINDAPDLDTVFRQRAKERGKEADLKPNINYGIEYIKWFRNQARTAQDLRRVVKHSEDPAEMSKAAIKYAEIKRDLDTDIDDFGPSIEKAYREYLRKKLEYIHFTTALSNWRSLDAELSRPEYVGLPEDKDLSPEARSRLEQLSRAKSGDKENDPNKELEREYKEAEEALKLIYPEGSPAYVEAVSRLTEDLDTFDVKPAPRSKADINAEIEREREIAEALWQDPMVQYFWQQGRWDYILKSFAEGKDVLEMPSVIRHLNTLDEWENSHQRTTIGGVLVGPPGVGKTTLIRHYLELKHRDSVYIDLSEDVTRYMLYGSKSIEFKSPVEYYKALGNSLKGMKPDEFAKFILENVQTVRQVFGGTETEAAVLLIAQIQESLEKGADITGNEEYKSLRGKVEEMAGAAFRKELGQEFAHIVRKNGWRDGVIIAALRRGDSVILDEFNKSGNWSLVYGLMTAKPGEPWYFADNDEWIDIPKHWRMYFTANIGKQHGVKAVPEALASRAGGKVMEIDYPPPKEEMDVALASIADAEGTILVSELDLAKLYYTVHDLFKDIRSHTGQQFNIPVSFRTIRDLGEKLIQYRDPQSGKHVYRRTGVTFDQALYDVLIGTYGLFENPKAPELIIRSGLAKGIFIDPSVEKDVLKHISEDDLIKAREVFGDKAAQEDYLDVAKKMKGLPDAPATAGLVMAQSLNI